MNITFDFIYFSPQSINPCYFASLTIMWSSAMLKYCGGLHPKMTIFSDFKVTIYMTVSRLSVEFRMQFSHSVMDNDKIETLSVPSNQKQTNIEVFDKDRTRNIQMTFLWCNLLKLKDTQLQTYRLVVKKFQKLRLGTKLDENDIVIYDGPGVNSKPLQPTKHAQQKGILFLSSTFQCVICYLQIHKDRHLKEMFSFTVMEQPYFSDIFLQHHHSLRISHPGNVGGKSELKIFNFTVDNGLHLNISIDNMVITGDCNDADCSYAGVASYNGQNEEFSIFCFKTCDNQRKADAQKFQHTYSNSNSLLFIIYWFEEFVNLKPTFTVRATPCRPIRHNVCRSNARWRESKSLPLLGSPVVQHLLTLTGMPTCTVLQLHYHLGTLHQRNERTSKFTSCLIPTIRQKIVSDPQRRMNITVTGYLRGTHYFLYPIGGFYSAAFEKSTK